MSIIGALVLQFGMGDGVSPPWSWCSIDRPIKWANVDVYTLCPGADALPIAHDRRGRGRLGPSARRVFDDKVATLMIRHCASSIMNSITGGP